MKKYSLLVIVLVALMALGACNTAPATQVPSYEDGMKAQCFALGGLLDKDANCVLVEAKEQTIAQAPVAQAQPVAQEPVTQAQAPIIPAMEWSNETSNRTYPGVKIGDHYEWWMDGYNHTETGEVTLTIKDFQKISYNSVSDGTGYVIEILNKNGESIYTFPEHANHFNDNTWFTVESDWYMIHIAWPNPQNQSNGTVIFAK